MTEDSVRLTAAGAGATEGAAFSVRLKPDATTAGLTAAAGFCGSVRLKPDAAGLTGPAEGFAGAGAVEGFAWGPIRRPTADPRAA